MIQRKNPNAFNNSEARFVHPSEFGMRTPVSSPQQLLKMTRILNGIKEPVEKETPKINK